jgi:signal transduction histidine kinase
MKLKFRNRIALLSAIAAAVTIGLTFFVVYGVVYFTAYDHLDGDILQEKEEVLSNLRWIGDSIIIEQMPEWEENEHQQIEVNPTFLQLVNAEAHLLFRSANLRDDILLFDPNLSREGFFNSQISGQRIRQGQFPIQNEQGKVIGHLTVGISQEESAIVLYNLRATLWIAFPLLLIVLFLATSLAASKGISPVKQLIQAASGISDTNINDRLPLPENKDELYQLATTINELLQRVENSLQREKQFTADASHEIRTPLTAIRGTLEVLLRKQRDTAHYEEKINRVIREVDRLDGMLDQLLQLARLERGHIPVNRTRVNLTVLLQSLTEKWKVNLQGKNMVLQLQIPPQSSCTTDAALLNIILDNLLGNAIKYGHPNGRIDCIWQVENATLTLLDNGPGVSEAHLSRLFDRFYRIDDARSATVPGTGLGLSISKKLADLLGIRLSVRSILGEGTTFTLEFPR